MTHPPAARPKPHYVSGMSYGERIFHGTLSIATLGVWWLLVFKPLEWLRRKRIG